MVEPILFYSLILGVSILALSLTFIALSYKRLLNKLQSLRQKEVEASYEAANEIIEAARKKASEIVASANVFTTEERGMILSDYKNVLKQIEKVTVDKTEKLSNDIYDQMRAELNQFREKLKRDLIAQTNLEKEMLLKNLKASIYDVIQEVSKETINRSLTIKEHEDIVVESLEEALKRHEL
jgi:inhibitor of KinA sporulation pathway (predicted exonuclease)